MSPEQFDLLNKSLEYVRGRVDENAKQLTDFRVEQERQFGEMRTSFEHRMTKVEVKAGVWGVLGGFLAGLGYHLKR